MACPIGCSEASSTPANQHVGRLDAVDGDDVDQLHLPGGDGAGLVEDDGVDHPGRLEHLGALDQHADLGAAASADQEGGRGRETQGAQAGDDEDRDRGGERGRGAVPGRSQVASVPSDSTITIGTKTPETRSASRWTCALPDWASSTSRAIWVRAGCSTRAARYDQAAAGVDGGTTTASSGPTSTGTGSPVSMEASMAEVPDSTIPSATFSRGGPRTGRRLPAGRPGHEPRCPRPAPA